MHTPNDPARPWRLLGKRCIKGIYDWDDWDDWDCTTGKVLDPDRGLDEEAQPHQLLGESELQSWATFLSSSPV
ncbi:unnamed protein product [Arctogadus glacialis]